MQEIIINKPDHEWIIWHIEYTEFFTQQLDNVYSYQVHIKHYKNSYVPVHKTNFKNF